MVKWDDLPIVRNINDKEDEYDDDEFFGYSYKSKEVNSNSKGDGEDNSNTHRSTYYFIDPLYNEKSSVTIQGKTNKILDTELCKERTNYEMKLIEELLHKFDVEYENLEWNGRTLRIKYNETHNSTMYREELSEYIDEFNYWMKEVNI